jgi:hypothetical protein
MPSFAYTVSQPFTQIGIYIMPVFKNGKVLRLTVPRYVARALQVGAHDHVTFRLNDRGEMVIAKFDVERLRDEYIQGRAGQLTLGTGGAAPPRDGARGAGRARAVDRDDGVDPAVDGEADSGGV